MSRGAWALLKIPVSTDRQVQIEAVLEDWWNSEHTNVAFGEHTIVYCLDGPQKEWYYDPRTINPYEDLLFICYRTKRQNVIEVVGTLQGREVMLTDGRFTEADMNRTRRAKIRDCSSPGNSLAALEFEEECFYFPNNWIPTARNLADATEHRVTWLLEAMGRNNPSFPLTECSVEEDAASLVAMTWVEQGMEFWPQYKPDRRLAFHKFRMAAEKYHFLSRFSRFRTERDIIRLCKHNGKVSDFCVGEPLDFQCFFKRFEELPAPTFFFKVPLEEVPWSLAQQLPLHPGMQLHLSYLDAALWIWNIYEIQQQRHGNLMQKDAFLAPWVLDQSKRILYHEFPVSHAVIPKRTFTVSPQGPSDPKAGFSVESQDLMNCMPPCMRNAMNTHFPRNQERMTLIPSLKEAGVSLESAVQLFENLNNRYPAAANQPTDLKYRFNVSALWNRNRGATFCKRIIGRTIQKISEQLHCPYALKSQEESSVPNCGECKRANGIPDMEDMYAPHLFLRFKLIQKSEEEGMETDTKKIKVEQKESSEEEEEEEEEEEVW